MVIRGTNPISLEAWAEDFDISTLMPLNLLAPNAPADALVSKGTFDGITSLSTLKDPKTGFTVTEFLCAERPRYLFVTGHSLGGTLTPPMFAYLNDVLYGGGYVHNMALWSFAGLTPGDAGFNSYFNGLFNPEFPWRLHNTLDAATYWWWSIEDLKNLYDPPYWGHFEEDVLGKLFTEAAGKGYAQPAGEQALPGKIDSSGIDKDSWVAQAMQQHHHTTYVSLVEEVFGQSQL